MRKVILELTASLDGYIEGPNREIDWIRFDKEAEVYLKNFADEIDTVLYGRVSYEMYKDYEASDSMPDVKRVLFSDTMDAAAGHEVVRSSELVSAVNKLKSLPGKNIWLFGGSKLITSFVNADLIDEYRVAVQPVILGAGNPLFRDISRIVNLKLVKATTWSESGIVQLIYERSAL